jgi:diguanylate cyclase (GGDEF)-like protein/PAS domain S-box-containing protein
MAPPRSGPPITNEDGTGLGARASGRQSVEAALRAERARLANILDGTGAGTWEWDLRTRRIVVDERYRRMLGLTAQQVATFTSSDNSAIAHPDDLARCREQLQAHFDGLTDRYEASLRVRRADGSWLWVLDRGRVSARDPGGAPTAMHGIRMDVTEIKAVEDALRATTLFLDRTGRLAAVGGWEVDLTTLQVIWSDETCRLFGRPVGDHPTRDEALAHLAPGSRRVFLDAANQAVREGTSFDVTVPVITAQGARRIMRTVGSPEIEHGRCVRLAGAFQDVTVRAMLERELAESHELLQVTLQSIGDAVITVDPNGAVRWLNPAAEDLTAWSTLDAAGRPIDVVFAVVHEMTGEPVTASVIECLLSPGGSVCADAVLESRLGERRNVEGSASPMRSADGSLIGGVLVFRDVSEQRRLAREMTFRAQHDPLTGLANRTEFEHCLDEAVADAAATGDTHALLYLDLDQFKVVNDSCGHHVGDDLLRQVSKLLLSCVRSDDLVARLGGDEFGIVLTRCTAAHATAVAEDICERLEGFRFRSGDAAFRVGASIGLVPIDDHWNDAMSLLQAADSCCYAAKDAGRNRVHCWHETDVATAERQSDMQRVGQLEHAIDHDQLLLYGQRIVPVDDRSEDAHLEVLVRMLDTDGSVLPPGAFLPAAERFNMAGRVDRWVVRAVVDELTARHAERGDLRGIATVAVNLSGQSISDRAFHRFVFEQVARAPFDPRVLCFEITETAAITHLADAASFIDGIRRLGVKVSLDDFGSGVSSFGYLKSLAVDYLKIDGQFIRQLVDDALDRATVRCFRDVANVVGVRTIAEWVEEPATREVLRELGIDYLQGYLAHRPEPLAGVLDAVQAERRPALDPVVASLW